MYLDHGALCVSIAKLVKTDAAKRDLAAIGRIRAKLARKPYK